MEPHQAGEVLVVAMEPLQVEVVSTAGMEHLQEEVLVVAMALLQVVEVEAAMMEVPQSMFISREMEAQRITVVGAGAF